VSSITLLSLRDCRLLDRTCVYLIVKGLRGGPCKSYLHEGGPRGVDKTEPISQRSKIGGPKTL
jgi:hypothetical protein